MGAEKQLDFHEAGAGGRIRGLTVALRFSIARREIRPRLNVRGLCLPNAVS
jgi:hypothetical protein